jgi:hypothetical protein
MARNQDEANLKEKVPPHPKDRTKEGHHPSTETRPKQTGQPNRQGSQLCKKKKCPIENARMLNASLKMHKNEVRKMVVI